MQEQGLHILDSSQPDKPPVALSVRPPDSLPEVEYWKAMYEGLRSGISDETAVRAAAAMVAMAAEISAKHGIPFRQAFTAMMEHMYGSRAVRRRGHQGKNKHERRRR